MNHNIRNLDHILAYSSKTISSLTMASGNLCDMRSIPKEFINLLIFYSLSAFNTVKIAFLFRDRDHPRPSERRDPCVYSFQRPFNFMTVLERSLTVIERYGTL